MRTIQVQGHEDQMGPRSGCDRAWGNWHRQIQEYEDQTGPTLRGQRESVVVEV